MTRPDVKQKRLGDFLDWNLATISQTNDHSLRNIVVLDGALQSLVNMRTHTQACMLCAYLSVCVCMLEDSLVCVYKNLSRGTYKSWHDWYASHNSLCGFSRCVMHLLRVWDLLLQVT